MEELKKPSVLCKDCIHCKITLSERIIPGMLPFAKCAVSAKVIDPKYDLVTGKLVAQKQKLDYCSCFRIDYDTLDHCGSDGKYWKPKNKNGLFLYLKRCGPK